MKVKEYLKNDNVFLERYHIYILRRDKDDLFLKNEHIANGFIEDIFISPILIELYNYERELYSKDILKSKVVIKYNSCYNIVIDNKHLLNKILRRRK